jgi:LPXTG-motif cell wall-anchored protein
MTLTANTDFLITSAVSSSSACTDVTLFLPGAQDYICYSVHNPYTEPFTVETISIAKTTAPTSCPVSNLDLSATSYAGTPALAVAAHGTGVVAEPISMVASPTTQDACLGAVFHFTNAGTARVTTPTTTTTTAPSTTTTAPVTTTAPTTIPVTTTTQAAAPLALTGADIAGMTLVGALAVLVGGLLLLAGRRRRQATDSPGGGPES